MQAGVFCADSAIGQYTNSQPGFDHAADGVEAADLYAQAQGFFERGSCVVQAL
jgi:hypothetical protein